MFALMCLAVEVPHAYPMARPIDNENYRFLETLLAVWDMDPRTAFPTPDLTQAVLNDRPVVPELRCSSRQVLGPVSHSLDDPREEQEPKWSEYVVHSYDGQALPVEVFRGWFIMPLGLRLAQVANLAQFLCPGF